MRLNLEFTPEQAILIISDRGERTEVRGNPAVGGKYIGDPLDRIVAGLPKTVNVSGLFADDFVHLRPDDARVVRAALAQEDEWRRLILTSTHYRAGD